jgi:outer membrane protein assembly factor BamB
LRLRATATGTDRWAGSSPYIHPEAAALDGPDLVVVGTRAGVSGEAQECGEVALLDRATATVRWSARLRSDILIGAYTATAPGEPFPPSPGLCENLSITDVTVGTRVITLVGKNLLSFDRATGRLLYATAPAPGRPLPPSFPARPMARSLAAIGDLAIISSPTDVRAVDPFTRQPRWVRPVDQDVGAVAGSGVVVAQSGARLVVIDAGTGAIRWSKEVLADAHVRGGLTFLTSIRSVRALSLARGRQEWTRSFAGEATRVNVVGVTVAGTVLVRVYQQRTVP